MQDYEEDWLRHQAHVIDAARGDLPLPPNAGWSVKRAAAVRRVPADFPALMEIIAEHKGTDDGPENLPERVGLLVIWNLTRGDLDQANARGAAWAVLVSDMRWHDWDYRNNLVARRVLDAGPRFFERDPGTADADHRPVDVAWVAALIRDCFLSPAELAQLKYNRMRAWYSDALEHHRQKQEAKELQHKLDFRLLTRRSRQPGSSPPPSRQFRRRGGTR